MGNDDVIIDIDLTTKTDKALKSINRFTREAHLALTSAISDAESLGPALSRSSANLLRTAQKLTGSIAKTGAELNKTAKKEIESSSQAMRIQQQMQNIVDESASVRAKIALTEKYMNVRINEQYKSLKNAYDLARKNYDVKKSEYDTAKSSIKQLDERIVRTKRDLELSKHSVEIQKKNIADLGSSKSARAVKKRQEYEENISRLLGEQRQIQRELNKLEAERNNAKSMQRSAANSMGGYKRSADRLSGQLQNTPKYREATDREKAARMAVLEGYRSEVRELDGQVVILLQRLEKLDEVINIGSISTASKSINSLNKDGVKLNEAYEKLNDSLDRDNANLSRSSNYTDEYKQKLRELAQVERQLINLQYEKDKADANPNTKLEQYDKIKASAIGLANRLETVREELDALGNDGGAGMFKIVPPTKTVNNELDKLNNRIDSNITKLSTLEDSIDEATSVGSSRFARLGNIIKNIGKVLLGSIQLVGRFFKGFKSGSRSSNNDLRKLGKSVLQFGLGFRSMYFLIKRLRSTFIDSFKQMAAQIPEVNKVYSQFLTQLNQIKGSLATAFQPIASVVLPLLSRLMSMLSGVMDQVGKFFAVLTGQNKIFKFTAANVDYAASLDKTGASASKAKKKLKDYLSPLDEISKYSSNNDDTSDSGSGAGGAGANAPTGTYTTEAATGPFADLANQIKDLINQQDWIGIGTLLGEKANEVVDMVPWDTIGANIGSKLDILFKVAYGFLSTFDFTNLGSQLAVGLESMIENVDWSYLGRSMTLSMTAMPKAIIGFLTTFNFAKFGKAISDFVFGFIDELANFIRTTNWSAVGFSLLNGLLSAIRGINVIQLIGALFSLLSSLTGALIMFIFGAFDGLAEGVVSIFEEIGTFVIDGFKDGIWEGIKNIGKWLYEHLIQPFVDAIKSGFDINSPSKVMSEIGGFIVQGLFGGITSKFQAMWSNIKALFQKIINFFTGDFKTKWVNAWNSVSNRFSDIFGGIKDIAKGIVNGIIGTINGLISGVVNGLNNMIGAVNGLHFTLPDWVPLVGGKTLGFTIPSLSAPQIPMLAQGAVIPPNKEFLAMLGDQHSGRNIEAPEDLIRQIVREEANGGNRSYEFTAQINRRTLFDEFVKEAKMRQIQTGINPLTSF